LMEGSSVSRRVIR